MKFKQARFLTLLILIFVNFKVTAQSSYTIYYQSRDSIYRIDDLSGETQLIVANIPQIVIFSHSGRYAAYYDKEGAWISKLDIWSPEKVISPLPKEAFALYWTPDDTRLILSLAFWPKDTDPVKQPLAYNLLTKSAEPWIWGQCDQIAQHTLSKDFALICKANETTPKQPINVIALDWGGEFRAYDTNQYKILRGRLLNHFPAYFNWGLKGNEQNIVYVAETSAAEMSNTDYYPQFVSLWDDRDDLIIYSPQIPAIEPLFAVSHDRSLIAYTRLCGSPINSCLEIANLETGKIMWGYEKTIHVEVAYEIHWTPDNQKVVLIGANSRRQHIVQIFDIKTSSNHIYDIEDATGTIAVS